MQKNKRQGKTWKEKFIICLKEQLTINDIKDLRDVSGQGACEIRQLAIEHLISHNDVDVDYYKHKTKIPTEAVFAVTNHNQEYYYRKMLDERKATV